MTFPPLQYYAEHLPNISSVTLTISSCPQDATFGLSSTGSSLTLTNSSSTTSIPLPAICTASGSGLRISQDPRAPGQVVIRLPAVHASSPHSTSVEARGPVDEQDDFIPWSATQIDSDVQVHCKSCTAALVERGRVRQWKDLPSEGWAEMMDLWHCHKPDEHHLHSSHTGEEKGYAAGARLVAQDGVGLVDVLGFLLTAKDCAGVEVSLVFLFAFLVVLVDPFLLAFHPVNICCYSPFPFRNFRPLFGQQEGVLPDVSRTMGRGSDTIALYQCLGKSEASSATGEASLWDHLRVRCCGYTTCFLLNCLHWCLIRVPYWR